MPCCSAGRSTPGLFGACERRSEARVCEALRRESSARPEMSDKELVGHQVEKIVLRRDRIEVEAKDESDREEPASASKIVIPFSPTVSTEKGITREPADNGRIDAVARQKLLNAIRRASKWVEAVRSGEADPSTKSLLKKA